MPKGTTITVKKKTGKTLSYKRKRKSVVSKLIGPVRSVIERKENIATISGSGMSYDSPTIVLINGIDQGTTNATRVGTSITVKGLYAKLQVVLNTGTACAYSIRIVYDKQPNGAAMVINSNTVNGRYLAAAAGAATLPYAQTERSSAERYVTLWAEDGVFNPQIASNSERFWFEKFISTPMQVTYSGSGATITSITSGSIYLIAYTDLADASAKPTLYGTVKCVFTDD